MDRAKYFRRRQWVLGSRHLPLDGWTPLDIDGRYKLAVHPDLAVHRATGSAGELVLLGYAINPYAPEQTSRDIVLNLASALAGADEIARMIETLSGRFVLICILGREQRVYHDAVGLRQVTFCRDAEGHTWCASQAETLAEAHGFDLDPDVLAYRDMPLYRKDSNEFWLLGDRTPYREITHLLPNHYLDLASAQAVRFWPTEGCIPRLSVTESVARCNPILQDSIKAASQCFDLKAGLSSGMDSRKTLAASRHVRDRLTYFSHAPDGDRQEVNDVRVPARLLPRLGLQHDNLGWIPMCEPFRRLYESSATWAREKKGHIAHTLFKHFGPETCVMNSNISEVAQCVYWLPPWKLDGEGLAILSGLNHPFAVQSFQTWVDDAKAACDKAGMEMLDLFFLEQRMGRWAVAAFAEYDIVHETFNPYNNRRLHSLMLAVPARHRRDRRWEVPLRQIRAMWPEVLCEPVNPQDRMPQKVQQVIRRYVVHKTIAPWLPAYQYLRYLKKRRRFRAQGVS